MAKPKKKMQGQVDRGKMQPAKSGNAAAVISHRFKPGSDQSARRHPDVSEYNPARQEATALVHRLMERRKK